MKKGKDMKRLTRLQVLEVPDIQEIEVEVPEWGGSVVLRGLTLEQARKVTQGASGKGGVDGVSATAMAIVEGMADPKLDAGDVVALQNKNAGVIARLGRRIMEMSGLGDLAAEVERAEKN